MLNLAFIGFSKADHSNAADDFHEYQTMQAVVEKSQGAIAGFAIIAPVIDGKLSCFKVKLRRAFKAQATFSEVPGIFGGVKVDFQGIIVVTNKWLSKYFVITVPLLVPKL